MRAILLLTILLAVQGASAQYYYKDIVGSRESAELVKFYLKNKVSKVVLSSYDAPDQKQSNDYIKNDDFYVEQYFSSTDKTLKTVTRSSSSKPSTLVTYFNADGNVIKTIDSSSFVVSWTDYHYNSAGQLLNVISNSSDSAKTTGMNEQHIWQWENNHPIKMLRVKNRKDTFYIDFKVDENGNVIEEQETHNKVKSFPIFYYYNGNNQLTDIARFSPKANQVIADYMFEYSDKGQVIQKITVPANNTEYLIWRYQYAPNGLKTKEVIYNKQKKPAGKIEYQYLYGS